MRYELVMLEFDMVVASPRLPTAKVKRKARRRETLRRR